jgi:hypothetical protein
MALDRPRDLRVVPIVLRNGHHSSIPDWRMDAARSASLTCFYATETLPRGEVAMPCQSGAFVAANNQHQLWQDGCLLGVDSRRPRGKCWVLRRYLQPAPAVVGTHTKDVLALAERPFVPPDHPGQPRERRPQ